MTLPEEYADELTVERADLRRALYGTLDEPDYEDGDREDEDE